MLNLNFEIKMRVEKTYLGIATVKLSKTKGQQELKTQSYHNINT